MDAIAAGGGLAGAAFALELARHGAKALIIERSAEPHHKVCGEFLSDKARALLHYLGIEAEELGGSRIRTLGLAAGTSHATAPLPFEAAALSRYRLDEALIEAAVRCGADVLRPAAVTGLHDRGGSVVVSTTRGRFAASTAALASGKHNVRGIPRPSGGMVGFKIYLDSTPGARVAIEGRVQLIAFSGGYLGLCLVEDHVLSIAWNIRADVLRAIGTSWQAQSAFLASESALFGDLTSGAKPMWKKPLAISGLPHGFLRAQPILPSIYPVGDQLAVLPSFAGDGMALALASGIAAAQAILNGEDSGQFQRQFVRACRPQFRLASVLDMVINNPFLRRAGLALARTAPAFVTKTVACTRLRGFQDLEGLHELQRSSAAKYAENPGPKAARR